MVNSISPLGMNFFVFASRIAKTTSRIAMTMLARLRAIAGSKIPDRVKTSSAAATAEVMRDTLLLALKSPINLADQQQDNVNPENKIFFKTAIGGRLPQFPDTSPSLEFRPARIRPSPRTGGSTPRNPS